MAPLITRKPPFLAAFDAADRRSRKRYTPGARNATIGGMADSMLGKKTRPAAPLKLDDFEPAARAVLPQSIYDYIAGGSEEEAALRGNRDAFARYRFRFKVLASTDQTDLSSELFG